MARSDSSSSSSDSDSSPDRNKGDKLNKSASKSAAATKARSSSRSSEGSSSDSDTRKKTSLGRRDSGRGGDDVRRKSRDRTSAERSGINRSRRDSADRTTSSDKRRKSSGDRHRNDSGSRRDRASRRSNSREGRNASGRRGRSRDDRRSGSRTDTRSRNRSGRRSRSRDPHRGGQTARERFEAVVGYADPRLDRWGSASRFSSWNRFSPRRRSPVRRRERRSRSRSRRRSRSPRSRRRRRTRSRSRDRKRRRSSSSSDSSGKSKSRSPAVKTKSPQKKDADKSVKDLGQEGEKNKGEETKSSRDEKQSSSRDDTEGKVKSADKNRNEQGAKSEIASTEKNQEKELETTSDSTSTSRKNDTANELSSIEIPVAVSSTETISKEHDKRTEPLEELNKEDTASVAAIRVGDLEVESESIAKSLTSSANSENELKEPNSMNEPSMVMAENQTNVSSGQGEPRISSELPGDENPTHEDKQRSCGLALNSPREETSRMKLSDVDSRRKRQSSSSIDENSSPVEEASSLTSDSRLKKSEMKGNGTDYPVPKRRRSRSPSCEKQKFSDDQKFQEDANVEIRAKREIHKSRGTTKSSANSVSDKNERKHEDPVTPVQSQRQTSFGKIDDHRGVSKQTDMERVLSDRENAHEDTRPAIRDTVKSRDRHSPRQRFTPEHVSEKEPAEIDDAENFSTERRLQDSKKRNDSSSSESDEDEKKKKAKKRPTKKRVKRGSSSDESDGSDSESSDENIKKKASKAKPQSRKIKKKRKEKKDLAKDSAESFDSDESSPGKNKSKKKLKKCKKKMSKQSSDDSEGGSDTENSSSEKKTSKKASKKSTGGRNSKQSSDESGVGSKKKNPKKSKSKKSSDLKKRHRKSGQVECEERVMSDSGEETELLRRKKQIEEQLRREMELKERDDKRKVEEKLSEVREFERRNPDVKERETRYRPERIDRSDEVIGERYWGGKNLEAEKQSKSSDTYWNKYANELGIEIEEPKRRGDRRVVRDRSADRDTRDDKEPAPKRSRPDESAKNDKTAAPAIKKPVVDPLQTRTGGAYIPPAKLRMMQAEITDKSSAAFQRLAWEALKKSINGLVNKVNVSNIGVIVRELLKENVVRGRGILCRSLMQAQSFSLTFTHVYAALVAVLNSKFPQIGLLLLNRLIIQFRRGVKRNDKSICLSSSRFIAHLMNQQVAHEVVALEILTFLLEKVQDATDDSELGDKSRNSCAELAAAFLRECGQKLQELSPRCMVRIFESLKNIINEGKLEERVKYMFEAIWTEGRNGFKDNPAVLEELDLVEEDDQITHVAELDGKLDSEDILNVFKHDPEFEVNEEKYKEIRASLLGESSDGEDGEDGSGSSGSDSDDEEEDEDKEKAGQDILDQTESNMLAFRRTIYLTLRSSLTVDEATHKILKGNIKPGWEMELGNMILDCCAQERTFMKFFALIAQRFCGINRVYRDCFQEIFKTAYETCHRLDTDKMRNVVRLFAHLFVTDAISWEVFSIVLLNEDNTTSSSRVFLKILFQSRD
ncbi:pre-mRNA-splicing factor CWC22 homolog [Hyalella azteca]|uniref:Pre-mRNA-splicing factor CWC22 homolog n=1 Tax=Hyalella azteca TaxID=294128 RepID=A0A979FN61_HYAAZ|nr:pre-mRNA-splicing factor CWC22 homolog [Hyalella azteca]